MSTGKTIAMIFVALAGFGVLLIGSCAGLLFMGFKSTDAAVSPHIDAMFAAIDNNTFPDTYESETTQELRNAASRSQ